MIKKLLSTASRILPRKTKDGFTLVEIMLATTLFVALIPVFLQGFISTSRQMQKPETDVAYQLARQGLENLREAVRADWWEDADGNPVPDTPLAPEPQESETINLNGIDYTASYEVSEMSDTRPYRKVEMTIQWPD